MLDLNSVEGKSETGIFSWVTKIPWVKIGGVMLALFSMSRTIDLVKAFLPTEQQVFAYAGVAAFDLGFLFWLWHFSGSARGKYQKWISGIMVFVDFVGMMSFLGMDILYRAAERGTVPPLDSTFGYVAIATLVAAFAFNVGAYAADSLSSPATRRRMSEQNAFDKIADKAIDHIDSESEYLAMEIAPDVAAHWIGHTRARFRDALKMPLVIEGKFNDALPSGGKKPKKHETLKLRDKIAKFIATKDGHGDEVQYASETEKLGANGKQDGNPTKR